LDDTTYNEVSFLEPNRSCLLRLNPYIVYCFHNPTSLKYEKGFKYLPRTTFTYELEYINYGEGSMIINDEMQEIHAGDVLFKTPGTAVQGIARYSSVIVFFAPVYTPNLEYDYPDSGTLEIHLNEGKEYKMMEINPDFVLAKIYHPLNASEYNTLFLNTYYHFLHKNKFYELQAKINLLRIVTLLSEAFDTPTINQNDPHLKYYAEIRQAEEYIRWNYRLKLYVPELAGLFNMSTGFFNKLFKKYLKQTPIQYQINYRLEKSKELLFHTSKTVREISYECGFNSDTYFETLFTKYKGKSPTQYRKEQTEKYFTCCKF
jgi:AraC-like DNA-binding protein